MGEGGQVRDSVLLNADETKGRQARRVFVSTRPQRDITDHLKRTQPRAANPYLSQSQKDGCLWIHDTDERATLGFTECGLEGLKALIAEQKR